MTFEVGRRNIERSMARQMAVDVGRLLRIKGALEGTLKSAMRSEGERSPFAGKALGEGYNRYRAELRDLLEGSGFEAEFDRLCPPLADSAPPPKTDLFGNDAYTGNAAAALHQAIGWVEGLIKESEMRMNAEAYAQAKLKSERGVGFKP